MAVSLTECPSCRTVHQGQPRFCADCGHDFALDPSRNLGFFQKRLTRTQQWVLAAFTIAMALVVALSIESPPENPGTSSAGNLGRAAPMPTTAGIVETVTV